jgi:protein-tyrosine phosphatase
MNRVYHHIPTPSFKGKLYLSSINGIDYLEEMNIGYVVSLFPILENQTLPTRVHHDQINISDRFDFETIIKMNSTLNKITVKIADKLSNNINVLVHCFAGISRSATVVCDFICKYEQTLLDDSNKVESSIEYVRQFREQIKPNHGFIKLLKIRNETH